MGALLAVGRGSDQPSQFIVLEHNAEHTDLKPYVVVGKGITFDSGGISLKPGQGMEQMKYDMSGAAATLGIMQAVATLELPIRVVGLIPAVENMPSGKAYRPGDVLKAMTGKTIEVISTDAEGRLILADALALADEEAPDALVCMATLTGAARVALGPDLPPFYTDDEALAAALAEGARRGCDPLWRMPFHEPYEALIEPGIADLDNAPSGGMAGSITAALFLRRFVRQSSRFVHLDIYGWSQKDAPGRTKGGLGQGARALLSALPTVLGLEGA